VAALDRVRDAPRAPLGAISPLLREAVVLTEDERFYQHGGVDLLALLRAAPFDLSHLSFAQGASTIAEQLAKLVYLDGNDRSAWWKAKEIALGYRLGQRYRHETILEDYLNIVYLGEGRYGVEAASAHYFRRSASKLSLGQASLLAGLIEAPSRNDPQHNPEAARWRQVDVLRSMVRNGYITETDAEVVIGHQLASGASLPPLLRIDFAPGSPFDWGELVAAAVLLSLALTVLTFARVASLPLRRRALARAASLGLIVVSIMTAAHSIQVL
jgi:membrane peptidoglycan carboxypeptidase